MCKRSAIENYIYSQYTRCAAKRGYSFELDIDTFFAIADAPCVYCGAENTNTAVRNQYAVKTRVYNGVDRINSELPYTVGNTVSACKHCNAAKTNMALEVFLNSDWLKARKAALKGL
jgi:hypothetical protein